MTAARRSGQTVLAGDGRRLTLGKHLKSGGAGSIYLLPDAPTEVAKLYHPGFDRASSQRKIAALLGARPNLPDIVEGGQRYVQMAWPGTTLHELDGQFCGFLMPAIDIAATSELELVLQDKQARAHGLPTGLGAKITLAANLAAVIAELHAQHHYVVDLKPVNLRFYRETLYMALLDCDGLSVHTPAERFHATQFTPEYLAPEFQSGHVSSDGEERQDRFALAVVIFQLLNFGLHPFAGRPQGDRVPTDLPGRIAGRFYAYGLAAHKRIAPVPSSTHRLLPVELRQMFDLALGTRDGRVRPSAAQWASVLKDYARRSSGKLVVCERNAEHQHFAGLACAACVRQGHIEKAAKRPRQAPPKPPGQPAAQPQTQGSQGPGVAPGAAALPPGLLMSLLWTVIGAILFVALMLGFIIWIASPSPPSNSNANSISWRHDPSDTLRDTLSDDKWERELRRAGELALKGEGLPFNDQMRRLWVKAPIELSLTDAEKVRYRELLDTYYRLSRERGKEAMEQLDQVQQELYELNPYERGIASEQAFFSAIKLPPLRAQARGQSPQAPEAQAYQEALARVERAFAHSLRGEMQEIVSKDVLDSPLRGHWFGLAMLYFEREQYEAVTGALAIYHGLPEISHSFDHARLDLMRKTWLQRDDYKQECWDILDARAKIASARLNGSEVAPDVSELAARPWPAEPPAEKTKKSAASGR